GMTASISGNLRSRATADELDIRPVLVGRHVVGVVRVARHHQLNLALHQDIVPLLLAIEAVRSPMFRLAPPERNVAEQYTKRSVFDFGAFDRFCKPLGLK